jgi:hypothetical protein
MPEELDREIADRVALTAIGRLRHMRGGKVVTATAVLRPVILDAIQEAYEIGILAAEKRQLGELTRPGSPMEALDEARNISQEKRSSGFRPVGSAEKQDDSGSLGIWREDVNDRKIN